MAKLRADHCGLRFSVDLVTEKPVDAERYVRCIVCGALTEHTTDTDLDRWEYLQSILPEEPPIPLLKLLITEYFVTNRAESFIDYYNRRIDE